MKPNMTETRPLIDFSYFAPAGSWIFRVDHGDDHDDEVPAKEGAERGVLSRFHYNM